MSDVTANNGTLLDFIAFWVHSHVHIHTQVNKHIFRKWFSFLKTKDKKHTFTLYK